MPPLANPYGFLANNPNLLQGGIGGMMQAINQPSAPLGQILGSFGYQGKPRRHIVGLGGRTADQNAPTGLDWLAANSPYGDMSGPENRQEYLSRRYNDMGRTTANAQRAAQQSTAAMTGQAQAGRTAPLASTPQATPQAPVTGQGSPESPSFLDRVGTLLAGIPGAVSGAIDWLANLTGDAMDQQPIIQDWVLDPQARLQKIMADREREAAQSSGTETQPQEATDFGVGIDQYQDNPEAATSGQPNVFQRLQQGGLNAVLPEVPGVPQDPREAMQALASVGEFAGGAMGQPLAGLASLLGGQGAGQAVTDFYEGLGGFVPNTLMAGEQFMNNIIQPRVNNAYNPVAGYQRAQRAAAPFRYLIPWAFDPKESIRRHQSQ